MSLFPPFHPSSAPLALELNPLTIAAQQREIHRLESLPVMNPEWRKAVLRFVEERREDICTEYLNRGATLHAIAETDTPAFAFIVDRMLDGDLSGLWLLCGFCTRAACGGGEQCRRATDDERSDGLSPEAIFKIQIPEYLHEARAAMLAARGMERSE